MSGTSARKTQNYQSDNYKENDKENIPLKMNYSTKNDKKFVYGYPEQKTKSNHKDQEHRNNNKDAQIQRLTKELKEERSKVKYLQATIIEEQSTVLHHLELLEGKFQEVTSEKNHLEVELHRLKNQNRNLREQEQQSNDWKENYQNLSQEHKKIKKIADSLIDMMKKVDGIEGGVHDAWKWVKKIVWEYEGIRTKALQWKAVYDQINQAATLIEK